jgi:hypothetical protein
VQNATRGKPERINGDFKCLRKGEDDEEFMKEEGEVL